MLTIDYTWHPVYPQKADEQLKQSCKCFLYNLYFGTSGVITDNHQRYKKRISSFDIILKYFKDFGIIIASFH